MRRPLLLLALLAASGMPLAAESPAESCGQLRSQIGALPPGDADLLRRLAARNQECGFSSADFYKAAYGDRPPAREAERPRRSREHDEDDDD
ncbi:MAG TPA: hypothetical protein VF816_05865 [Rhodocyclaceae bacterium]